MSGRAVGRRDVAAGGVALLMLTGAAAKPADVEPDARLLAIARRVIRAAEDESRACLACDHGDPDDAQRLEAVERAFRVWSDQVRQMAAVPAVGAVGLAVKAAVILRDLREGRTEATEALASSLAHDIARITPSVARLTA